VFSMPKPALQTSYIETTPMKQAGNLLSYPLHLTQYTTISFTISISLIHSGSTSG
jgi:hypothetical protein